MLNNIIEFLFCSVDRKSVVQGKSVDLGGRRIIKKSPIKNEKKQVENITLDTPLLECGFSFNAKFREYFSALTGISPFKFTADMATAWRKVKRKKNIKFKIGRAHV